MAPKKKTREGDSSLKRSQGNPILAELEDSIAVLDDSVPVIEAPKRPVSIINDNFGSKEQTIAMASSSDPHHGNDRGCQWFIIFPT